MKSLRKSVNPKKLKNKGTKKALVFTKALGG